MIVSILVSSAAGFLAAWAAAVFWKKFFAEGMESYIGCEYYAACLPGGNDPYVVVLSNVSAIAAN